MPTKVRLEQAPPKVGREVMPPKNGQQRMPPITTENQCFQKLARNHCPQSIGRNECPSTENYTTLRTLQGRSRPFVLRPVVPGGARGAMATPNFGPSFNPISNRRNRLCPHITTGTPGFSDLPTALVLGSVRSFVRPSVLVSVKL